MHLNSTEQLGAYPILQVRDQMVVLLSREWFSLAEIRGVMGGPWAAVRELTQILLEREWLQVDKKRYTFTIEGARFLKARAMRPITRATAERLLRTVIERVTEVNAADYAFTIEQVEVFGSYLSAASNLGDLDIYITLAPRLDDPVAQEALYHRRIQTCPSQGFLARQFWPKEEVWRTIRRANRAISLHEPAQEPSVYATVERRTIWPPRT